MRQVQRRAPAIAARQPEFWFRKISLRANLVGTTSDSRHRLWPRGLLCRARSGLMHCNEASLFDNLARGNLEEGTILIAFAVCKLSTNSSLPPAFGGPVSELCDKRLARSQGAARPSFLRRQTALRKIRTKVMTVPDAPTQSRRISQTRCQRRHCPLASIGRSDVQIDPASLPSFQSGFGRALPTSMLVGQRNGGGKHTVRIETTFQ
jgi:hypothetical protein